MPENRPDCMNYKFIFGTFFKFPQTPSAQSDRDALPLGHPLMCFGEGAGIRTPDFRFSVLRLYGSRCAVLSESLG